MCLRRFFNNVLPSSRLCSAWLLGWLLDWLFGLLLGWLLGLLLGLLLGWPWLLSSEEEPSVKYTSSPLLAASLTN
jgi:hypothetical protein